MSNPRVANADHQGHPSRETSIFPATVNVADPVGLADLAIVQLSVDSQGRLRTVFSGTAPQLTVQEGIAESLHAAGTVTAPGAGAAIATLAAPPAGTYEVIVHAGYGSNAGAVNNMELQRQAVAFATPLFVADTAGVAAPVRNKFRITLSGAQNLTVNAIAAGAAGDVYIASITAMRVA